LKDRALDQEVGQRFYAEKDEAGLRECRREEQKMNVGRRPPPPPQR